MYQKFIIVKFSIIKLAFAFSLSTMENVENTEFPIAEKGDFREVKGET